jgi:PAS domain S-box-containing protein
VLSESEQRFAATYEHAAIGISEVDAEGRRLRVNEAACRITGRTREEMLGAVVFDTLHPDDRDDDASQHRRLVAGEIDRYALEKRYIRGNGEVAWLSVLCSALRDQNGKFLYSVRVFHDITETKRAVHALAESEQRLAATYEHAAIAISEIDANGRLIRVNETACAITGYPREELLGLSVFELTHPTDRTNDSESYRQQASDKAGPYAIEKRVHRKDGQVIWVSVVSSSVRDAHGMFLYGIRVMQDITARKRAEDMVRESEQRLRQVLEALPTAVYTTDASGHVNFYNQAAVELSGRQPELDADKWCVSWRLYDPDGRPIPHDQCPMAIALKENRPIRGQELVVERPDGTIASVVPYPTPLHDGSGTLVGAVNMLVDITERKHAEARQKTLIDELNHRVKNTLATVQSLAGQTLRGSVVAAKVRDSLTARLFALSKTHDHLSRAGWESADFKSIATDIFAPFQLDADDQVRLSGPSVRLPPNCALLLGMVLHELVTNAAKYGALSRSSGKLDVNWTVENGVAGRRLLIDWQEAGGPRVRKPERRGFGSRLAERAIGHELRGSSQISFDPSGVSCKFEIPLGVSTP